MEDKRPFAEADQSAVGCPCGRWRAPGRRAEGFFADFRLS